MVHIVGAAMLAVVLGEHATAMPSYETPPELTAAQKSANKAMSKAAKKASRAATPQVLSFFASDNFRKALQECCPKTANYSALELLEQFRAEAQIAELAHAFPAVSGTAGDLDWIDVTPEVLRNHDWFLNEWQAGLLNGSNFSKDSQNTAAVKVFKLPVSPDIGYSWDEAADRMIFAAHNMNQLDTGSQSMFGDVTAIFSTNYVKHMVFIAPMDTGLWGSCANGHQGSLNCSAWEPSVVGTLKHHDHLILSSWGLSAIQGLPDQDMVAKAKQLFSRSAFAGDYTQLPPSSYSPPYWESNIVGNPRLTESVKFLIANFPVLFGTDAGRDVQRLADEHNWPLVWAFGAVVTNYDDDTMNRRFIDPGCAQNTNMTADHGHLALASFNSVWLLAEAARSVPDWTPRLDAMNVRAWWTQLQPTQTRVAPLTAHSCSDSAKCFATSVHDQDCICKVSKPTQHHRGDHHDDHHNGHHHGNDIIVV